MKDDTFWAGWNYAEREDRTGDDIDHHLMGEADFQRGYDAYYAYSVPNLQTTTYGMTA